MTNQLSKIVYVLSIIISLNTDNRTDPRTLTAARANTHPDQGSRIQYTTHARLSQYMMSRKSIYAQTVTIDRTGLI